MKAILASSYSFVMFLSTVAVAFAAEEVKHEGEGGYDAMAYVWIALIAIILVYGVYDSFFKPID